MLWLRGLLFTLLVPAVVGGLVPMLLLDRREPAPGWARSGWLLVGAGGLVYLACLLRFLAAGGTPAIFFTRGLRSVIGEEPGRLVGDGLYRYSRNPMYLGVVMVVFGMAVVFLSAAVAIYGAALWLALHFVVVFVEEPHLRRERGADYDAYCRRVPRWLGRPRPWSIPPSPSGRSNFVQ
jgi:protein-S-isoprenylcysteine O-methyltransferase Ste14